MTQIYSQENKMKLNSRAIYFATSSKIKFEQYKTIFRDLGFELRLPKFDKSLVVEPQIEPADVGDVGEECTVVRHVLESLYDHMEKSDQLPFFVEDTMLIIDALSKDPDKAHGLPGADTKNWWYHLGDDGLLKLLNGQYHRNARFTCQIGLCLGKGRYHYAKGTMKGTIAKEKRIS